MEEQTEMVQLLLLNDSLFPALDELSPPRGHNPLNCIPVVTVTNSSIPHRQNSLRFANINARSLKNKTAAFVSHILDNKIDLCIVTETWLKEIDTVSIAALCPPGYFSKSFPRQTDRSGGGTGAMFKTNFNVSLLNGGEKKSFEFSEWNFAISAHHMKVVAVYRPPYSQAHPVTPCIFFEEFSNYLESIVMCSEILIIAGDFNFHFNDQSDTDTKRFIDMLETFGLKQHVTAPTHSSNHTLDLLITRSSNDINISSLETTFFLSDHCFVECYLSISHPDLSTKEICFRETKKINLDNFKTDISQSNLCMNDSWSNLDDLMECYNDTLVSIFDKHAPIRKKITVGKRRLPWFSANVKHLKTERRKLERKMRKSKQNIDRAAYRKICNKYSALLKEARRKYYTDLIDECSNDSKKLFKVVTSFCKAPRDEPQLPPHDDLSQLTNMFGEYFYRKIKLIRNDIDNTTIDPQPVEYRRPEVKLESFAPVSDQEVHDIIMQSSNASCELDPIPSWLVKLCSNELTPILTKIINLSLEEGHVPDAWKIALLKPFLKKSGLEAVFENFRPVCNLSFISKSAEKAVIEQLFEHCDENAPLPSSQSAYRKNYSTETALLKVQNDILMSMDKQEIILLVLLDLSSAFDTIDHKLMLDTLEFDFGVTGKALLWLKSFLSDRKQRVHIKKEFSKDYNVNHGVPQGSCLGPVLFLLYISQLFDVVSRHLPSAHGYADDTQLYMSFRPESSIAQNQAMLALEECITDMRSWLLTHRLMFKDSKTEFLIIGTRQQLSKIQIDSVKVGGVDIKPVEKVRNLGSWFDNHMSMNIHVGKVCSKAFRGLYNIRQIRKFLSMDSAKTLIHAFVTSHLDYCNSLLAGIPQYQLQRLQKVLNAAARLIYQSPRHSHITPILVSLHWLPVKFRVDFKIALLVYKALNGSAPSYISALLSPKSASKYDLRSDDQDLHQVPATKLKTVGDRAFTSAAPRIWNTLPLEIRQSENISIFKKQLKTFFFKNAFNV